MTYKAPDPKDLYISGSVDSDDTMNEFLQHLEFEIEATDPLKFQLTIDRKHKYNIKLSKPVCHLHFSNLSQMIKIVEEMTRVICLIAFKNNDKMDIEDVSSYLDNMFNQVKHQIVYNIQGPHMILKGKLPQEEKIGELLFV